MADIKVENLQLVIDSLKKKEVNSGIEGVKVYEKSYTEYENTSLLMVKEGTEKRLLAAGEGSLYNDLRGDEIGEGEKICPLTYENRLVLNQYFDYTVPQAFGTEVPTIGLGDRLGLASPGHIEIARAHKAKPVLAQQSIRELTLTDRTMNDILDAASFAVFQEGYKDGFGADGDHLKEEPDIQQALKCGMSMLTLDCSDYIQNRIEGATSEEIRAEYQELPQHVQNHYIETYLNKTFDANGVSISFDEASLMKNALIYGKAIDYMLHVNKEYIGKETRDIDFEVSIDETETITAPAQHFFVANELKLNSVDVASLAPRFCGEFQKGIDYIGDIEQFGRELSEHARIADYFGYKLSIHSGSDKFKVFPIISKYTNGRVHVKTAGTNWLEAVRVIAEKNPDLYRRMHAYALDHFEETKKYYHITPDLDSIKPIEQAADSELPEYMNDNAARQLLHVTFGILLTAKDDNGKLFFKNEFYDTLNREEAAYRQALVHHIGNHLETLNL